MNIKDVDRVEITGDRLYAIFARQTELMEKYKEIEGLPNWPVEVNVAAHQKVLKDFAWRITEELAEATISIQEEFETQEQAENATEHFHEELADALHFMVELCILSNIDPKNIVEQFPGIMVSNGDTLSYVCSVGYSAMGNIFEEVGQDLNYFEACWKVVERLGAAMNCLKNKPWKQTQVLTDENKYRSSICEAFICLLMVFSYAGLNEEAVADLYFRKSEVNKFRQRSNY